MSTPRRPNTQPIFVRRTQPALTGARRAYGAYRRASTYSTTPTTSPGHRTGGENAAATIRNCLITTAATAAAHTLTASADHLLPWALHLGCPDLAHHRASTATHRGHHHLATTAQSHTGPQYQTARELLHRRDQLLDHFHEMRRFEQQLDNIADRNRTRYAAPRLRPMTLSVAQQRPATSPTPQHV